MKADTGKPDRGWSKKEEVREKRETPAPEKRREYVQIYERNEHAPCLLLSNFFFLFLFDLSSFFSVLLNRN
jgi:hypothetical protein